MALRVGLLRVPLRSIPSGRLRRHYASLTPPRLRRCALRLPMTKGMRLTPHPFFISYPPLPSVASPHGFAVASSAFASLTVLFFIHGGAAPNPPPSPGGRGNDLHKLRSLPLLKGYFLDARSRAASLSSQEIAVSTAWTLRYFLTSTLDGTRLDASR